MVQEKEDKEAIKFVIKIAQLCKKHGVKVVFGSDAHVCFDIGEFDSVKKLVSDIEMPEELIMNCDEKKIYKLFTGKR